MEWTPHVLFASVAAPLTELTRKGSPTTLVWESAQQNALIALRTVIASQPILCLSDYSEQFLLQTDASDTGISAILLQETDGLGHPIGFANKKLFPREQNYATTERECFAIVWGINKVDNFCMVNTFYGKSIMNHWLIWVTVTLRMDGTHNVRYRFNRTVLMWVTLRFEYRWSWLFVWSLHRMITLCHWYELLSWTFRPTLRVGCAWRCIEFMCIMYVYANGICLLE